MCCIARLYLPICHSVTCCMVFWYLIVTKGAVVLAVLLYIFAKYGINFNSNICVDVIIIFFCSHNGNPWCFMGEWVDTLLVPHIYPLQVYGLYSCCSCMLSTTSTANLITSSLSHSHTCILRTRLELHTVTAGISTINSPMVVSLQGFAESSKCKMLKWFAVFGWYINGYDGNFILPHHQHGVR